MPCALHEKTPPATCIPDNVLRQRFLPWREILACPKQPPASPTAPSRTGTRLRTHLRSRRGSSRQERHERTRTRAHRAVLDDLRADDRVPEERPECRGDEPGVHGGDRGERGRALLKERASREQLQRECDEVHDQEYSKLDPACAQRVSLACGVCRSENESARGGSSSGPSGSRRGQHLKRPPPPCRRYVVYHSDDSSPHRGERTPRSTQLSPN
ncbi:hypothetical protein OH76DRAFT_489824 [Lentinus brumalis]|uniref:Uncharacterized protein n=1 Tax=Lentinus brumalis TaxID=2498619 RepID=A0A371CI17_9APHY|nr:hypothetical protein OH76DRAFT_489824 [Polyporus brumalis]